MSRVLYKGKWDGIWDRPKYQEMRKKITESFKGLTFIEEGHKYFLNGKEMMCVSNVAHMFQEHFDSHAKAQETFERNFNNERSKYYRMTAEEIEKAWAENSKNACEHGTERHEFAECAFYFLSGQNDKIYPEFKDRLTDDGGFEARYPKEEAVVRFYEDMPQCVVPILAEVKVYYEESNWGYSGTFDLIAYYDAELEGKNSSRSGIMVLDWKTNKDLYKNFMEKHLLPPLDGLLDCPLSIYKAQLSLYQNCLEHIGIKVIARRIMWLLPDGTYQKIPLEDYSKRIILFLHKKYEKELQVI